MITNDFCDACQSWILPWTSIKIVPEGIQACLFITRSCKSRHVMWYFLLHVWMKRVLWRGKLCDTSTAPTFHSTCHFLPQKSVISCGVVNFMKKGAFDLHSLSHLYLNYPHKDFHTTLLFYFNIPYLYSFHDLTSISPYSFTHVNEQALSVRSMPWRC